MLSSHRLMITDNILMVVHVKYVDLLSNIFEVLLDQKWTCTISRSIAIINLFMRNTAPKMSPQGTIMIVNNSNHNNNKIAIRNNT